MTFARALDAPGARARRIFAEGWSERKLAFAVKNSLSIKIGCSLCLRYAPASSGGTAYARIGRILQASGRD
ncbi:hypothetical protein GCM10027018_01700 [Paenibacillus thermoaerophilus]